MINPCINETQTPLLTNMSTQKKHAYTNATFARQTIKYYSKL